MLAERFHSFARERRDRLSLGQGRGSFVSLKIALRPDEHAMSAGRLRENPPVRFDAPVQNHEQKVTLVHGPPTAPDTFGLDLVAGGVNARSVEYTNRHAGEDDRSLDDVPRRPGNIGND